MSDTKEQFTKLDDRPLSNVEEASWQMLVADGAWIRRGNRDELMPSSTVLKRIYHEQLSGESKHKMRKGDTSAMPDDAIPNHLKRWFLARRNGVGLLEAHNMTGATFQEMVDGCVLSETLRCAREGMFAAIRMRLVDKSYNVIDMALGGKDVNKLEFKAAMKVLESQESEHFGKKEENLGASLQAMAGSGGITINLVDTHKAYLPPTAAQLGDGKVEEAVEV